MAAKDRTSLTITWSEGMVNFVRGPVFDKTRTKIAQLSELAMEAWLKENGYWEQYEQSLAQDIL
jgi:hypothetical protein